MRSIRATFLAAIMLATCPALAKAEVKVVASIKPVHSLVAAVMQGVGTADLIVDGAGSPHTYALKPSQARQLQDADLVFWMGHDLEAFLEKPIAGIAKKALSVELMDSQGLSKISFRKGGDFDDHHHDDARHESHEDHEDHKDDEDHAEHEHADNFHDAYDHEEDAFNPHVWLDPVNATAMVREIAKQLSQADPANAPSYNANASRIVARLNDLIAEINAKLAPVKGRGYVVFHDAYQYFETRFDMMAVGAIAVSPDVLPGAERVRNLQDKIRRLDASCVFSEPQFEPKLVATVVENTTAATGILDPLGASIEPGPELYFTLIRTIAGSMKDCLS